MRSDPADYPHDPRQRQETAAGLKQQAAGVKPCGEHRQKGGGLSLEGTRIFATGVTVDQVAGPVKRAGKDISEAGFECFSERSTAPNRRLKGTENFWLQEGSGRLQQVRAAYLREDGRTERSREVGNLREPCGFCGISPKEKSY